MISSLSTMGIQIDETEDGVQITGGSLVGGRLRGEGDHRVVMALTIAALAAKGKTTIQGVSCVEKSFPSFFPTMRSLGAHIEM